MCLCRALVCPCLVCRQHCDRRSRAGDPRARRAAREQPHDAPHEAGAGRRDGARAPRCPPRPAPCGATPGPTPTADTNLGAPALARSWSEAPPSPPRTPRAPGVRVPLRAGRRPLRLPAAQRSAAAPSGAQKASLFAFLARLPWLGPLACSARAVTLARLSSLRFLLAGLRARRVGRRQPHVSPCARARTAVQGKGREGRAVTRKGGTVGKGRGREGNGGPKKTQAASVPRGVVNLIQIQIGVWAERATKNTHALLL